MFAKFDKDGNGIIDYNEFRAMLPALGLHLSDAKARKYFRIVDADRSGNIDLLELKVALCAWAPPQTRASPRALCPVRFAASAQTPATRTPATPSASSRPSC